MREFQEYQRKRGFGPGERAAGELFEHNRPIHQRMSQGYPAIFKRNIGDRDTFH